jgi:hypothetical protein
MAQKRPAPHLPTQYTCLLEIHWLSVILGFLVDLPIDKDLALKSCRPIAPVLPPTPIDHVE